ncbi:hypothetical protein [Amycolatopsis anabasis]|uniref:hypothetical protein n=1 Tax=Amycolatopsis anabasis TaxID=1840409 RepID=UPI00131CF734|nr:hypothetical protein [Amycolatopsis anabasis]
MTEVHLPPPPAPPRRRQFHGAAITALVLGIVALCGSPLPILNNATIIAGFIGVVFAAIGLFGARKVMSGFGLALSIAGIAIGLALQAQWSRELGDLSDGLNRALGPPPPSPEKPAVPTNERGNILKELGAEAAFGEPGSEVRFAIDKIEVDPKCDQYAPKREPGRHTLVLHIRVATGDDAGTNERLGGVVNPFSIKLLGEDGLTVSASPSMCLSESGSRLSTDLGPNQRTQGVLEIEAPMAHGTLIVPLSSDKGWEWKF